MSFIVFPGVITPPLTPGAVPYGTGSQVLMSAQGTAGQVLVSGGGSAPTWSAGAVIPAPLTAGGVVYGTGTAVAVSAAGSVGQPLLSGGSGVPIFGNLNQISQGNSDVSVTDTGANGTITFTTDGTERMRVTNTGVVGIGTTSNSGSLTILNTSGAFTPSNYLSIQGSILNNSNYPGIELKGGTLATTYPQIALGNGGLNLVLKNGFSSSITGETSILLSPTGGIIFSASTLGSPSAVLTVLNQGTVQAATTISVGNATPSLSGAGITFPATQSASTNANTLDDYEEGTWNPTDGSGAGLTFNILAATYTKIGRAVTVIIDMQYPITANGLDTVITNLPFTVLNPASCAMTPMTDAASIQFAFFVGNQNNIRLYTGPGAFLRTTNAGMSNKFVYLMATYVTS